ncbi:hypothetical protein [Rhodococcus sp. IEGM 1408]|uniref:hypothetical protein n=1 Tax=Rhodococcus sp. IEGM 1408 TaxID=3082220 RepID=UPI0029546022|nr:hypothetical protein [Rhodococcus sp. IEGM 1408]MDV8001972.1 hypothetical protein [Rhodococcus sp. IEGM 1408]
MAAVTETQVDSIKAGISQLESAVFTVIEVTVEQDDDPQGEATRVTIELEAKEVPDEQRLDAFVSFGRAARRVAFDVLGEDRILRVAYRVLTEGQSPNSDIEDGAPDQTDKSI